MSLHFKFVWVFSQPGNNSIPNWILVIRNYFIFHFEKRKGCFLILILYHIFIDNCSYMWEWNKRDAGFVSFHVLYCIKIEENLRKSTGKSIIYIYLYVYIMVYKVPMTNICIDVWFWEILILILGKKASKPYC